MAFSISWMLARLPSFLWERLQPRQAVTQPGVAIEGNLE
jgi:hypothetical protein